MRFLVVFLFLIVRPPLESTPTDTLFPSPTLVQSGASASPPSSPATGPRVASSSVRSGSSPVEMDMRAPPCRQRLHGNGSATSGHGIAATLQSRSARRDMDNRNGQIGRAHV